MSQVRERFWLPLIGAPQTGLSDAEPRVGSELDEEHDDVDGIPFADDAVAQPLYYPPVDPLYYRRPSECTRRAAIRAAQEQGEPERRIVAVGDRVIVAVSKRSSTGPRWLSGYVISNVLDDGSVEVSSGEVIEVVPVGQLRLDTRSPAEETVDADESTDDEEVDVVEPVLRRSERIAKRKSEESESEQVIRRSERIQEKRRRVNLELFC